MEQYVRTLTYLVTDEDGPVRAEFVLRDRMHLSGRECRHLKTAADGMMVGDMPVRMNTLLVPGHVLTARLYEAKEDADLMIPAEGEIEILYEDEDLIVINKPAGVAVHPAHGHYSDSLANLLAGYFVAKGEQYPIRVLGRLDKETSGAIVFAKNRAAVTGTKVKKEYIALCSGVFEPEKGTVNAPIEDVPDELMLRRVAVAEDSSAENTGAQAHENSGDSSRTGDKRSSGRHAVTHYNVERQESDFALVRLNLETGRTHQIRVHMHYLGHPLLGDRLYGKEIIENHGMERAALHAEKVVIERPFGAGEITVTADIPGDMRNVLISC